MGRSETSPTRRYKALHVDCPECNASAGRPCVDKWSYLELRGVHRARDIAYNEMQARESGLWEPKR